MPLKVFPRARPSAVPSSSAEAEGPQHFASPSKRDLRAQSIHRLQVGIFGLCAMLLLVGLANIIMNRARLAEGPNPAATTTEAGSAKAPVSDPLADIGVVPAADASGAAGNTHKAP